MKSQLEASDKSREIRNRLTAHRIVTAECGHRVIVQSKHFGQAAKIASKVADSPCPNCAGGDQ